jgi:hypothetical protein
MMSDINKHACVIDHDGMPDSSSGLAKLLSLASPRQRCIDQVTENLASILQARCRKITWNVIAESLGMNRGTLINAVKVLTEQPSRVERITATQKQSIIADSTVSLLSRHYSSDMPSDSSPGQKLGALINTDQSARTTHTGITILGRTKIENFNL